MSAREPDEADEMELSGGDLDKVRGPGIDAWAITRRAREAYGPDGRPPLPEVAGWPIFPFDSDGLRVRSVEDPVLPEPQRAGEATAECRTCAMADADFIWTDDRWRVSMAEAPASLPGLTLHSRAHLDFHELTEDLGAELGVLLLRGQRALGSIHGVGRVHVYEWGDGGAHLHIFLVARPHGMVQLRGMFLSAWMAILQPLPDDDWSAIRAHVAGSLAAAASP